MPAFQSDDPKVPAVDGAHSSSGTAVAGHSVSGMGVHGLNDAPDGASIKPNFGCGLWGESRNGYGVWGSSDNASGVVGESLNQIGVNGQSVNNVGVMGRSTAGNGMHAQATGRPLWEGGPTIGYGLFGVLTSTPDAVFAFANSGAGVAGVSSTNMGVLGVSAAQAGVEGHSTTTGVSGKGSTGVFGVGETGLSGMGSKVGAQASYMNPADLAVAFGFIGGRDPVFNEFAGVYGESDKAGVFGNSNAADGTGVHGRAGGSAGCGVRGEVGDGTGAAIQGTSFGRALAGRFFGAVQVNGEHVVNGSATTNGAQVVNGNQVVNGDHFVNGNLHIGSTGDIAFADCAEEFELHAASADAAPGSVVIMDDDGTLRPCDAPYDTRVVGVISGAGRFRPAITLDRIPGGAGRAPVALMGKVCCRADASFGAIRVGDLMTTSPTAGHAMRAGDREAAFGAVLGKALEGLESGRGEIALLVCLQ